MGVLDWTMDEVIIIKRRRVFYSSANIFKESKLGLPLKHSD